MHQKAIPLLFITLYNQYITCCARCALEPNATCCSSSQNLCHVLERVVTCWNTHRCTQISHTSASRTWCGRPVPASAARQAAQHALFWQAGGGRLQGVSAPMAGASHGT